MARKETVSATIRGTDTFSDRSAEAEFKAKASKREAEAIMNRAGTYYASAARMNLGKDDSHAKELFAESGSAFEKGNSYLLAFHSYLLADKLGDARRIIKDLDGDDLTQRLSTAMPKEMEDLFEKIRIFEILPEGAIGEQRATVVALTTMIMDTLMPLAASFASALRVSES